MTISNHVWIGQNVTILKGSNIGNNNVVGSGAIVTNKVSVDNCILEGIGGKVLNKYKLLGRKVIIMNINKSKYDISNNSYI